MKEIQFLRKKSKNSNFWEKRSIFKQNSKNIKDRQESFETDSVNYYEQTLTHLANKSWGFYLAMLYFTRLFSKSNLRTNIPKFAKMFIPNRFASLTWQRCRTRSWRVSREGTSSRRVPAERGNRPGKDWGRSTRFSRAPAAYKSVFRNFCSTIHFQMISLDSAREFSNLSNFRLEKES